MTNSLINRFCFSGPPAQLSLRSSRPKKGSECDWSVSYEGAGALIAVAFLWWQENMGAMTFIDHKVTPAIVRTHVTKSHIITFESLVIVVCIRYPF